MHAVSGIVTFMQYAASVGNEDSKISSSLCVIANHLTIQLLYAELV